MMKVDTSKFDLRKAVEKQKRALEIYADTAAKKLMGEAKNPPFPLKPEKKYTEKEIILFKTLKKRGLLKRKSKNGAGHYKWRTRTGNARESINGTSGWEGGKLKVVLSGGMDYSVYLELAHEKQYAVLKPTIDKNAPEILRGYQKLVKD